MSTLTRKQREIAQRELLILEVARRMVVDRGYLGLSMDRVAEAAEYSKGTIYQHFSSKEDLLGALALETDLKRAEMFARATRFNGRTRERITAVGVADEVFVRLYPDHFRIEQIANVESISGKISESRQARLREIQEEIMEDLKGVVRAAVADGDLVLDDGTPEVQVLFGLWTMSVGGHTLETSEQQCVGLEDVDMNAALWANYQRFLDGYGWQPLSTEWDYQATVERVRREIFADECRRLET